MFDCYNGTKLNFKIAPIMAHDLASNQVINTEYKKLSTLNDLAESGHKDLPTDEIRQLCSRHLRKVDLQYSVAYSET